MPSRTRTWRGPLAVDFSPSSRPSRTPTRPTLAAAPGTGVAMAPSPHAGRVRQVTDPAPTSVLRFGYRKQAGRGRTDLVTEQPSNPKLDGHTHYNLVYILSPTATSDIAEQDRTHEGLSQCVDSHDGGRGIAGGTGSISIAKGETTTDKVETNLELRIAAKCLGSHHLHTDGTCHRHCRNGSSVHNSTHGSNCGAVIQRDTVVQEVTGAQQAQTQDSPPTGAIVEIPYTGDYTLKQVGLVLDSQGRLVWGNPDSYGGCTLALNDYGVLVWVGSQCNIKPHTESQ